MNTTEPRVDMSDAELNLIADLTGVPVEKVRGIVWLAEWRMRDKRQAPSPHLPLGPIGQDLDPCAGCSPYCNSTVCPKRIVITYTGASDATLGGDTPQ